MCAQILKVKLRCKNSSVADNYNNNNNNTLFQTIVHMDNKNK